ncbi:hypothetical protein GQ53DRAFT_130903 [Thozetella sp. PMI_491]|nr:hypothetical protein GQ53DRAFT_130903 [Thozetella sp. PMI_491]
MDTPWQFTHEQGKALRRRVKGISSQTEREKWIDIYRILFPDEEVPEPYYCYDAPGTSRFMEFFQREFPPRIKKRLEENLIQLDQNTVDNILEICLLSNSEVHGLWDSSCTVAGSSNTTVVTDAASMPEMSGAPPNGLAEHGLGTDRSSTSQYQTVSRREPTPSTEGLSESSTQILNPNLSQAGGQLGEQPHSFYGGEELLIEFDTAYQFNSPSPGYFDQVGQGGARPYDSLPSDPNFGSQN